MNKIINLNINIDNLLNNAGLSNEEVTTIINNTLSSYAKTSTLQNLQSNNNDSLSTTNKNIIDSINEINQSLNNKKQSLITLLGASETRSFEEKKNKKEELIEEKNKLKEQVDNLSSSSDLLKSLLVDGGYPVNNVEDFSDLMTVLKANGLGQSNLKQIVCGENHAFLLTNGGDLYASGYAYYGQLGTEDDIYNFTLVATDVVSVAAYYRFTLIAKSDGTIWATGRNSDGQLGLNSTTNKTSFTKVTSKLTSGVVQVSCGAYHSAALKSDGTLYTCGRNEQGQLGSGSISSTDIKVFTKRSITNVKKVCCGDCFTVVLKNDGTVWSCGENDYGQLGINTTTNTGTFTQATNLSNIIDIDCGNSNTVALKSDGSIWVCGYNGSGQLGLGHTNSISTFTQVTGIPKVKSISCGESSTAIICEDNYMYGSGSDTATGLSSDVKVFTKSIYNVNKIDADYSFLIALKNDNSLWGLGSNSYGQLGLGDGLSSVTELTQILY